MRGVEAGDRVADMAEAGLQAGIELAAGGGQRNRPHLALEQFDAEQFLEPANLMAERARRDVQLSGRARQAEMARGRLEGAQSGQRGCVAVCMRFTSTIG